ncbi:MAG: hydrolase [Candidatus Peregrinibacteria bacterium GW2011_GWC2_39_14]|nr:MAG: hydrolase [Candidatus Peregrinibacteria bacterium GW2011_GWC2_39_14]
MAVIHGGPGGPGEMKSVTEELSKEHGVLEPLQTAHSIEGQILELKETLNQHATFPVILIGHSWGAWLSYLYATRYSGDVKKLILVSSPGFKLSAGEKTLEERLKRLSETERKRMKTLLNELAHPDESANEKFLKLAILAAKADAFDPLLYTNDILEAQFDIYQSVWKEAEQLRANGELLELGKKITCPTVALHGDHDPHSVQSVQQPLSRVLSHFRFISIKNCGHRPWIERQAKDKFYRILKQEIYQRD